MADFNTDHRLVLSKMSLRITSKKRTSLNPIPKRLDVSKLKALDVAEALGARFETLQPGKNWDDFKVQVFEASADILGYRKKNHQDWFSDYEGEISQLLDHRRELYRKTLVPNQSETEKAKSIEEHRKLQKQLRQRLRFMKYSWWDGKAREVQAAADSNNTKQLYLLLREVYGPTYSTFAPLRSKDGSTTSS